jgi:UDP-arabinose 4-epimerase
MQKAPILVTGGAGYIGSHACKALAKAGFTPVVVDNLSTGSEARVQWGPLEKADVRDPASLAPIFKRYKPQAVMHFAGQISVPDSIANPHYTYAINTVGSFNVLEAMRAHEVSTIVFSSTAAVYGIPEHVPIPESAPKQPINPYGQSKLNTELMLADYARAYGFKFAALRYFNAVGATPKAKLGYQRPDPFHLIPIALLSILERRPPMKLFGTTYPTPDGTAIRDYVHVVDLAAAHVLALEHLLEEGESLTLNLGTSNGYSVKQVLAMCEKITGKPVPHTLAPARPGDPAVLVADATAAAKLLKWRPRFSILEQIIADDWQWHKSLS